MVPLTWATSTSGAAPLADGLAGSSAWARVARAQAPEPQAARPQSTHPRATARNSRPEKSRDRPILRRLSRIPGNDGLGATPAPHSANRSDGSLLASDRVRTRDWRSGLSNVAL